MDKPSSIPSPPAPMPPLPTGEREIVEELEAFRKAFEIIQAKLQEVVVGQETTVRGVLSAVFLQGHVLLEGVPGLGKTLLVNTLGAALGLRSNRVQFTPDLMPSDITGTRVIKQDAHGGLQFEFERGPVFTQFLLADEINRATPKTQSALLEAMQERHVTIAGTTYPLPEPFVVLATQNPLEQEGTYPLPEAQLDRFLFKLLVRFPTRLELIEIMKRTTGGKPAPMKPVIDSAERIMRWSRLIRQVPIGSQLLDYSARLLLATHPGEQAPPEVSRHVRFGASPRGLQAIVLASKLRAVLQGRYTVNREDINDVAKSCLRHRVLLSFDAEAAGINTDQVIDMVIQSLR